MRNMKNPKTQCRHRYRTLYNPHGTSHGVYTLCHDCGLRMKRYKKSQITHEE